MNKINSIVMEKKEYKGQRNVENDCFISEIPSFEKLKVERKIIKFSIQVSPKGRRFLIVTLVTKMKLVVSDEKGILNRNTSNSKDSERPDFYE